MWTALLATASAAPTLPTPDLPVVEERLDNGLRVLVQADGSAPLVAVQVRYAVGSADERAAEAGLAHLVEHAMYGGSPRVEEGEYDALLADVGAENNAWTDHDETVYVAVAPREALDLVLFLEADRMTALRAGDADTQRAVVAAEAADRAAQSHARDRAALQAALYPPAHPYAAPVIGRSDAMQALDADAVRAFHTRWYGPANATLVVVGDVDPVAVFDAASRWFGPIPSRPTPARASHPPPVPGGERRATWFDGTRDDLLYLVWPTVPRGHPDEPALDLLSRVLAADGRGVVASPLVHRGPRLPGVVAWTDNGRLGGIFVLEVQAGGRRLERVRRLADRALERARRGSPGVRLAQEQLRWHVDTLRALDGRQDRAEAIGRCSWDGGGGDCHAARLERYAAVTPADLARVLERYLGEDRLLLGVVDPNRAHRALRAAPPVVLP